MENLNLHPTASVVIVSDYRAGDAESEAAMRRTLHALEGQDFEEPWEVLLVVSASGEAVPADISCRPADLRVLRAPGETSYDLKNHGATVARAPVVLLLDADCAPAPDWLGVAVRYLRDRPSAAVVSGRTLYHGQGVVPRLFALLDRTYVDTGKAGATRSISNNNAAFRHEVLSRHPLRNDLGPFGARAHADEIIAAGGQLRVEPAMTVRHEFEGLTMARDIRRGQGFAIFRYRQLQPTARHAWIVRLGYGGIPVMVCLSVLHSWWRAVLLHGSYGLRWYEVPLAFPVALILHVMEIPGMIDALRGRRLDAGVYR